MILRWCKRAQRVLRKACDPLWRWFDSRNAYLFFLANSSFLRLNCRIPCHPKTCIKNSGYAPTRLRGYAATRLLRYHRTPNYRIPCHCPIKTCRPSERESNICLSRSKSISFEQKRYHFMFLSFFNRIARAKRIAFYVSLVLKACCPSKKDSIYVSLVLKACCPSKKDSILCFFRS